MRSGFQTLWSSQGVKAALAPLISHLERLLQGSRIAKLKGRNGSRPSTASARQRPQQLHGHRLGPGERGLAGQPRLAADADQRVELGVLGRGQAGQALAAFGDEDMATAALGVAAALADELAAGVDDGLQQRGAGGDLEGQASRLEGQRAHGRFLVERG